MPRATAEAGEKIPSGIGQFPHLAIDMRQHGWSKITQSGGGEFFCKPRCHPYR
jgi:hypothetical protein